MNINSSRNLLLRARNLRSAKRSRAGRILSSRTTNSSSSSGTSAVRRPINGTGTVSQTKEILLYEKMEKSAAGIQRTVKDMIAIGKMTYTDDEDGKKAQEKGWENLLDDIRDFVSDFNTVHGALEDTASTTDLAFKKTLDSVVTADTGALKEIGITVSKRGELSIDEKALAGADPEKVKALFAKANGFADKISDKMAHIEKSAASSLNVMNKFYGATSTYDRYGKSDTYYNSSVYGGKNYGSYNSGSWYF